MTRRPRKQRPDELVVYIDGQFDGSMTWRDLEWLTAMWGAPLAMKGNMTPQNARRAIDCGATGVMVSNHGGRQSDSARLDTLFKQ